MSGWLRIRPHRLTYGLNSYFKIDGTRNEGPYTKRKSHDETSILKEGNKEELNRPSGLDSPDPIQVRFICIKRRS